MNKEQWEIVRDGVLQFNRLVTTPEERKTEAYILKCYKLLDDEIIELEEAEKECTYVGGGCGVERKATANLLNECCDIIVTSSQAIDAITPSKLEWDYLQEFKSIYDQDGRISSGDVCLILVAATLDTAKDYAMDLFGAMVEVNRSNLSKLPTVSQVKYLYGDDLEMAMQSASEWIEDKYLDSEGNQRYTGVHGKFVVDSEGVERVVFRDKNFKVVKWVGFSEPNLEPYLGVK